jgi:hypothetical protein
MVLTREYHGTTLSSDTKQQVQKKKPCDTRRTALHQSPTTGAIW